MLIVRSILEEKRVRYLLGLASPAEREKVELEYFEDDDAFQEMVTAENDLFDAYVRGELAGEERRRFEKVFVSSLHGRDRVPFARAFAKAVSAAPSVQTNFPCTLLGISKTFRLPRLIRTATIAATIVFVTALACLMIDRGKITNELRDLRAHPAELSKRTKALQRSSDTERIRTAEIGAHPPDLQAPRNQPRRLEPGTTATQRSRYRPAEKNEHEELIRTPDTSLGSNLVPRKILAIASGEAEHPELLVKRADSSLGSNFVNKQITQLPLEARNVPGLLTLQTAAPRDGYVTGARADQTNITLDGVSVAPPNIFFLTPLNTTKSGETTVFIPSSLTWIRFQIALATAAIYEDYRIVINAADGRPVTSVDWTEPLTPNQSIIDTPMVSTGDLPPDDYVLILIGKHHGASSVKVAQYYFKVINY